MNTAITKTTRSAAKTVAELLDQEEALAIQRLTGTVQRLGDELCEAVDLRARIRAHPFLATGIAAFVGFLGAPALLRLARGAWAATTTAGALASARPAGIPELVRKSLSAVRAPR